MTRTRTMRLRAVAILLVAVMCVTIAPINASAAGVENLPAGQYSIGAFSFTDQNLTPVKTVTGGQYIRLDLCFRKADEDAGLGEIQLTIQIRDANTGEVLQQTGPIVHPSYALGVHVVTAELNLGYTGRKIQIWFDASSAGASNGNYRSAYVYSFNSIVR